MDERKNGSESDEIKEAEDAERYGCTVAREKEFEGEWPDQTSYSGPGCQKESTTHHGVIYKMLITINDSIGKATPLDKPFRHERDLHILVRFIHDVAQGSPLDSTQRHLRSHNPPPRQVRDAMSGLRSSR